MKRAALALTKPACYTKTVPAGALPALVQKECLQMTVEETFETMVTLFNPAAASNMNKAFQWNITGAEAGVYALKIANGACELIKGGVEKPDVAFNLSDQNWLKMADGTLDPQSAFFSGALKVTGDIGLALKVAQLFPTGR
jgi:putative sterol carrier protein